jgi:hypothetical protein
MLINERKDLYRLKIPVVWEEIDEIRRKLVKFENMVNGGPKQCLYSTQTFLNKKCITYSYYG